MNDEYRGPEFLRETISVPTTVAHWDLEGTLDGPTFSVRQAAAEAEKFRGAFPGVGLRHAGINWTRPNGGLVKHEGTAIPLSEPDGVCHGASCQWEMELEWVEPTGAIVSGPVFPALELYLERWPNDGEGWSGLLDLDVNLFTDEVLLLTRPNRRVDQSAVAARNRERLREGLRAWQAASGGRIVHANSDYLEEGSVDLTGILEGARSY